MKLTDGERLITLMLADIMDSSELYRARYALPLLYIDGSLSFPSIGMVSRITGCS